MSRLAVTSDEVEPRAPRPVFDKLAERDLRRISTVRVLAPPPSDPQDPHWEEAWTYFQRIYVPALNRFVYNLLYKFGLRTNAMEDADEIVAEFVCQRLRDGRLAGPGTRIVRFRDWLATQVRSFTIDRLRAQGAQRRRPRDGFAPGEALDTVEAGGADPALLAGITEQVVADVVRAVLQKIKERSPKRAYVLEDLIQGGGRQSPGTALLLDVTGERLRGIRREARIAFRVELVRMVHRGPFAAGDIEDLIGVLRRVTSSDAA